MAFPGSIPFSGTVRVPRPSPAGHRAVVRGTARPPEGLARSVLTALLLVTPASPQAFPVLVQSASPPPAGSDGAFCAVARWGGRLFVLRDAACLWTADAGATWTRREFAATGPKGRTPLLEGGWFTAAGGILCLGNRSGSLAWRYDAAAEAWTAWPAGAGSIAAAGSGDRLWSLSPDHALRHTGDAGVTWARVPLPDDVREGTFFDDLRADGDALLLRVRDRANPQRPAASLDGGATWEWLPAGSYAILAGGCAHAFRADTVLESRCPGGTRAAKTPFAMPEAAFADRSGFLYAWSGGRLYAAEGGAPSWRELAGPASLEGWEAGRDLLYRITGDGLAWFDGNPPPTVLRRNPQRPARPYREGTGSAWLIWKGRAFGLDGRLRRVAARSGLLPFPAAGP